MQNTPGDISGVKENGKQDQGDSNEIEMSEGNSKSSSLETVFENVQVMLECCKSFHEYEELDIIFPE